ncbi:MAG: PadR family transcriptional regulator [Candidatus Odinarchaeota archaeon]
MFERDINQFKLDLEIKELMGQGPPEREKPLHHPPFGNFLPFGLFPPFPRDPFRSPLPVGRESFQEIRDFIILLIISEYPNGITGYQLQEKYNFPRGTLIRTLQELEDKKFITSKEEIVDGRPNKFFTIAELGKKYLEGLKLKWANLFSLMSEITPSKGLRLILLEKIKEFESKDDASDFFRGLRSWMKGMVQRIQRKIENFKASKVDLDKIIEEIDKMDVLNKEKIIEMVEMSIKKTVDYENNE